MIGVPLIERSDASENVVRPCWHNRPAIVEENCSAVRTREVGSEGETATAVPVEGRRRTTDIVTGLSRIALNAPHPKSPTAARALSSQIHERIVPNWRMNIQFRIVIIAEEPPSRTSCRPRSRNAVYRSATTMPLQLSGIWDGAH